MLISHMEIKTMNYKALMRIHIELRALPVTKQIMTSIIDTAAPAFAAYSAKLTQNEKYS